MMHGILFTSIPKTGTNLLLRYIQATGLDRVGPFDEGELLACEDRYRFIRAIGKGQCCCWHFAWTAELSQLVSTRKLRVVFLCRDPRAQVVSNLHYIMSMPEHPWHWYMAMQLTTDAQRLTRLIEGIPPEDMTRFFPPPKSPGTAGIRRKYPRGLSRGILVAYRGYQGWLTDPNCLSVKFEDLIGPRGGGSAWRQRRALKRLMSFTGVPNPSVKLKSVAQGLFDPSAATFRKGMIDSWRQELTPELVDLFDREVGAELALWGYKR